MVLKYPEIKQAPNSQFFQPCPVGIEGVESGRPGTPTFPQQAEAALFNIALRELLGLPTPVYADLVRQEMNGDGKAQRRAAVDAAVRDFARRLKLWPKEESEPAAVESAQSPATSVPVASAPALQTAGGQAARPVQQQTGKKGR